tara:strand:- start:1749 stop:2459 length:711 start_codon:yes stop_codon:yes gene_type:complete
MFSSEAIQDPSVLNRTSYFTDSSLELSEIYKEEINILVWQRIINDKLLKAGEYILSRHPELAISEVVKPEEIEKILIEEIDSSHEVACISKDISKIVKIFCTLFNVNSVWLRLDAIDKPMCPRFHADYLKCRLVSTYIGPATQWIPHDLVNHSKLGSGNEGKSDKESGLFLKDADIKQLNIGDIGLLKGEAWEGNQGGGIVHRSPHSEDSKQRLYMTIDFVDLYLRIFQNRSSIDI